MKKIKELVGLEIAVDDLSNELCAFGCEDICEFGNWDEILESGNVVVATEETGTEHIQIWFDVTIEAGKDEVIEATYVRITDITKF